MSAPLLPLLLGLSTARADVPEEARWLSTDRVAVGLAADGSFGNERAGLGVLFDPDGPAGPMPLGGDVLDVGRVFEAWSLSATVDGQPWQRVQSAPWGDSDLVLSWEEPQDDGDLAWIHGVGGDGEVQVDAWVVLPWGQGVAFMVLDVVAGVDLQDLQAARTWDPDLDAWTDGSNDTENEVRDSVVVASGAWDGRAWALAAEGGEGGICAWCTLADEVRAGQSASSGDDQPGLAVAPGDLAAGEGLRLLFAYGFGADADEAAELAAAAAASRDLDGDGADWEVDCDDLDGGRHPGAEEQHNGEDDDCDHEIDEVEEDPGADTGPDRDDWDSPIPDTGGAGEGDGGAGGGDGGGGEGDGGAGGVEGGGAEEGGKGCASLPAGASLLGLLLAAAMALPRRSR